MDALETENNGANGTHADASHDDELEEIDWRDDAEPGEAIEETASVTGKRSRADDELASEDQGTLTIHANSEQRLTLY